MNNEKLCEIYDSHRLVRVRKFSERYERSVVKSDRWFGKKLRSQLGVGEKVPVLAERLKKKMQLAHYIKVQQTLHEKKNFCLTKICEKCRKDRIFVCFCMFPFHGNIIFYELSFKRKCKKAASFRKCVFLRKYEIFVYDSWT